MTKLPHPDVPKRIRQLTESHKPAWGRMTAHQMICHLDDSFLLALNQIEFRSVSNFFKRTVMKWGALYVPIPWPKDVPTIPEVEQGVGGTPPANFEADRARLLETIGLFCEPSREFDTSEHPMFGRMSRDQWMRWGYLHADHHLRQFGV